MVLIIIIIIILIIMELEKLKTSILGYLLKDDDENILDKFLNNESIETKYFVNLLENDDEKYKEKISKKESIKIYDHLSFGRILSQNTVNKNSILEVLKKVLIGKVKDKNNNQYSNINPLLIIIFKDELEEFGFEFFKTQNNFYELRHTSYKVNQIVNYTLKYVLNILLDDGFINLLEENRINFIKNLSTNKRINIKNNDIKFNIYSKLSCRSKIFIIFNSNIVSDSHCYNISNDNIEQHILDINSDLPLILDINNNTENNIYKIKDKIAKTCYKNNPKNSIAYYLTLKGLSYEIVMFFTDIYMHNTYSSNIINMKTIGDFMKSIGFDKFYKVLRNAIKNGDINVNIGDLNIDSKNDLNKLTIDIDQLTLLINYPRNSDWEGASEMKKYYSIFTKEYFNFLNDYLNNKFEEVDIYKRCYSNNFNLKSMHQSINIGFFKIMDIVVKKYQDKLSFKLNQELPFLVYQENHNLDKTDIVEKIYGMFKDNKLIHNITDFDYDNNLLKDIQYRISTFEDKNIIENYRLINKNEFLEILSIINI